MVRRAVAEGVMSGGGRRSGGGGGTPRRSSPSPAGVALPHSAEGSARFRGGQEGPAAGLGASGFGRRDRGNGLAVARAGAGARKPLASGSSPARGLLPPLGDGSRISGAAGGGGRAARRGGGPGSAGATVGGRGGAPTAAEGMLAVPALGGGGSGMGGGVDLSTESLFGISLGTQLAGRQGLPRPRLPTSTTTAGAAASYGGEPSLHGSDAGSAQTRKRRHRHRQPHSRAAAPAAGTTTSPPRAGGRRKRKQVRSRPSSPMGSPSKPAPGPQASPHSLNEAQLPGRSGFASPPGSGLGRSPSPLQASDRHGGSRPPSPLSRPALDGSPDAATILRNVAIAEAAADDAERAAASLASGAPEQASEPTDANGSVAEQGLGHEASLQGPLESPGASEAYSEDSFGDYGDEEDAFEDDGAAGGAAGAGADGDESEHPKPRAGGPRGGGASSAVAEPPKFRFDARDVGCRVRLRSARLGAEEEGTVTAFDASRGMHLVLYDSGDRKWHTLAERDFAVVTFTKDQQLPDRRRPPSGPGSDVPLTAGILSPLAAASGAADAAGHGPQPSGGAGRPHSRSAGRTTVSSLLASRFGSSYGAGPAVRSGSGRRRAGSRGTAGKRRSPPSPSLGPKQGLPPAGLSGHASPYGEDEAVDNGLPFTGRAPMDEQDWQAGEDDDNALGMLGV